MILTDYSSLVTSQHNSKPKFMGMTANDTAPYTKMQEIINNIHTDYDLDFAIGNQLDIIGEWVGISRKIETPLDIWFSWDSTVSLGWDNGAWANTYSQTSAIVSLPDEPYRFLIRAKILSNYFDGTLEGLYGIISALFPNSGAVILEYSDISIVIGVTNISNMGIIERSMITHGYVPFIPMGVRVREYIATPTVGSFFAWDTNTSSFSGWDSGQWYTNF